MSRFFNAGFGGKSGGCARCGAPVVSRELVERLISSNDVAKAYAKPQVWQARACGASYVYSRSYGSVVEDAAMVKTFFSRSCECLVLSGVEPALRMVREEHRQFIKAKFGTNYPLSFLFQLPHEYVAWENSTLVSVAPDQDGVMVLSDKGHSLYDVIRMMNLRGEFRRPLNKFKKNDVVSGYTYLYLIRSEFRAAIALRYGHTVMLCKLFKDLSLDWFDWDGMLSLHMERGSLDGTYVVSAVTGAAAVPTLAAELGGVIEPAHGHIPGFELKGGVPVVELLPHSVSTSVRVDEDEMSYVALHPGISFIPLGHIHVETVGCAFHLPPGFGIQLPKGTVLSGNPSGIVVIPGTAARFRIFREHEVVVDTGGLSGIVNTFQVPVVALDASSDTDFGEWLARKYDYLDRRLTVVDDSVDFVLIQSPVSVMKSVVSGSRFSHGDHDKRRLWMHKSKVITDGAVYAGENVVVADPVLDSGQGVDVVLNGFVRLAPNSAVHVMNHAVFTVDAIEGVGDLAVPPKSLRYAYSTAWDDFPYSIRGQSRRPIVSEAAQFFGKIHVREYMQELLESDSIDSTMSDMPYAVVARYAPAIFHQVGPTPTVAQLLALPAAMFDMVSLMSSVAFMSANGVVWFRRSTQEVSRSFWGIQVMENSSLAASGPHGTLFHVVSAILYDSALSDSELECVEYGESECSDQEDQGVPLLLN